MSSWRLLALVIACILLGRLSVHAQGTRGVQTGSPAPVDFERHVMGLLSKMGCNAGSCHGSFQGKNGFRLSLFGYEPARDHVSLTRDLLGRRINAVDPDRSLLLLKATGAVAHEGGMRFSKSSPVYGIFRDWIAGGARWTPGSGELDKLTISAGDFALVEAGKTLQLKVTATFADGSTEDVTSFCDFKLNDDAIASVSPAGQVTAERTGDAGLMILYRSSVAAMRILVPAPPLRGGYPSMPTNNRVDAEVFAKLKLLNMVPSDLASDQQFLRRIYIDTIAQLPSPDEVRAFLNSTDPHKRSKLLDRLLAHPLHAAVWATKLSDVTGNSTDTAEAPIGLQARRSQLWHDWLRKRLHENMPYDQLVRNMLTATSLEGQSPKEWLAFTNRIDAQLDRNKKGGDPGEILPGTAFGSEYKGRKTLDLFWRRQQKQPIEVWGERVAAAFLGVRLECAQCHKHPTDQWTQEDYWAFANLFAQVMVGGKGSSREVNKLIAKENTERRLRRGGIIRNNNINPVREVCVTDDTKEHAKPNPATGRVPMPRALGGPAMPHQAGQDTRVTLMNWLAVRDNPYFARSFVNRVWAHYFGIGIVNPVDDFSIANPPTNPRLLDVLAKAFVDSGYDIRKLERLILASRTYQLSYQDNATNKFDKNNFSHAYIRPLMAEQVIDVLNAALTADEIFPDDPPAGTKMVEIGASRLSNPNLAFVLRVFGRPTRTTACDCERTTEPVLTQTLFRMTDEELLKKFASPTGRLRQLLRSTKSNEDMVDELFLATLTREPTAREKSVATAHLAAARDQEARTKALTHVMWGLINSREFILNH